MVYECERIFGAVRGQEICLMVEDSTGDVCPCSTGGRCPLMRGPEAPVMLTLTMPVAQPTHAAS